MNKNESSVEGMKEGVLYRFVALMTPSLYKLSILVIVAVAIIVSKV